MLHTAQSLTKKVFLLSVFFTGCALVGCSLFEKKPSSSSKLEKISRQKVFNAPYDTVWRATHTVIKYPIATDNQDTGVIETEYVKALESWQPPNQEKAPSSGIRYKLNFTLVRGKAEGKESTRVTIEKKVEILKDFFSEPQRMSSDGLEEAVLFYRIERELLINEALKKAN